MPLQNRVLPTGEIVAIPDRGAFTGNRGIIHEQGQVLSNKRWSHHAWICCTLDWQGRKRQVMTGRNWTELFFLDEAVAFAAGHRPCGYCRRKDFERYKATWVRVNGPWPGVKAVDRVLHRSRVNGRTRRQVTFEANANSLPDGCFIQTQSDLHLMKAGRAMPFSPKGYGAPIDIGAKCVEVLTPKPFVEVFEAGYTPVLHPTAR